MAGNLVDFISLIKDIRGNQFDPATGLPINGKWFDIKGWHTSVSSSAAQVATDLAAVLVAKDAVGNATADAASALASKNAALASEQASAASLSAVVASAATASTKASESSSSATLSTTYSAAAVAANTASGNSATAAAASALTASTAATTATSSKNAAVVAETNTLTYSATASTSATNAANYSTSASNSATAASTKATEATAQRALAAAWAIAAENLPVNDGVNPAGFSAYHWALQAQAAVGGVVNISDLGDVPALTGGANKYLRVNAGATAIEFDALTKADVGLNLVDNYADIDKVISNAVQAALNTKSNQSALDTTIARVTTVEGNTSGLAIAPAAGSDPIRVLVDKMVYTSATQVLATLQDAALTTFGLLKAALAAETIGTY